MVSCYLNRFGNKRSIIITDSEEPEIPLGPNVAVKILYGSEAGKYGRVLNVDLAAGHCEVKLPDGSIHEVSERVLQTVTDKEYTEKTRIISRLFLLFKI
jgi:hypothetical protein